MKKLKEYWNNIDWFLTLTTIASGIVTGILFYTVAPFTLDELIAELPKFLETLK